MLLVKPKEGHDPTQERNGRTIFAAKIIPKAHLKLAGESFIKATMLERDLLADVQHPFLLSPRRAILRSRITSLDGLNRPYG